MGDEEERHIRTGPCYHHCDMSFSLGPTFFIRTLRSQRDNKVPYKYRLWTALGLLRNFTNFLCSLDQRAGDAQTGGTAHFRCFSLASD